MKKILFVAIALWMSSCFVQAQTYVQIANCQNGTSPFDFKVNGNFYRPLVCNYLIEFLQEPSGAWYISPSRQYTSNGHNVGGVWIWDYDPNNAANSVTIAKAKLLTDLTRIKNLGFTEIRLVGAGLINTGSATSPVFTYPTGSSSTYFSLLNTFLGQVNTAGLKVIFLCAGTDVFYGDPDTQKDFLKALSTNCSTNTTIMAYDLFNEPQNVLWATSVDDKYNFAKLVTEWSNCIHKNDQNHLVTIGLQAPGDAFAFDPSIMPIDFVSYHYYPSTHTNITTAKNNLDVFLYWAGKTISMPWIIGETGYSASDSVSITGIGNETDQVAFAAHTLQKATDCNCKGYSWWQYQQVGWGGTPPIDDHLGLFYRHSGTTEGGPKKIAYPTGNPNPSPFLSYASMNQTTSNCTKPSNYYTMYNGNTLKNSGYIKDENNVGLKNVVVMGKDWYGVPSVTFTDDNGFYSLNSNGPDFAGMYIALPGYESTTLAMPAGGTSYNFTLKKTSNNDWGKHWTNHSEPANSLDHGTTPWVFSAYDKFYKGDFNGDGQEDLFCVKYTNSSVTNDRMAIYTYKNSYTQFPVGSSYCYNIDAGWTKIWDNNSNSSNGGGIYPYRNSLVVGDFDGDGRDDVISVGYWTTTFYFGTDNDWHWADSNYGDYNNPLGQVSAYYSKVIAGDFYGVGRDALIGINPSNNWIASFQLNSGTWTLIHDSHGQSEVTGNHISFLTPYLDNLIPANIDASDAKTEILGSQSASNGKMAVLKYNSSTGFEAKWYDATGNTSGMGAYRVNLQPGNIDNDANFEVLGINSSFCVKFDFNTSTTPYTIGWDGGYYSSISDWNIPSAYKYMFINTDKNAPYKQEHLFSVRNTSGTFTSGLYFHRANVFSSWPCSTLRLMQQQTEEETKKEVFYRSYDDIMIYPNPTEDNFTVMLPALILKASITVNLFDIQGKEMKGFDATQNGDHIDITYPEAAPGIYFIRVSTPEKSFTKKLVIL